MEQNVKYILENDFGIGNKLWIGSKKIVLSM